MGGRSSSSELGKGNVNLAIKKLNELRGGDPKDGIDPNSAIDSIIPRIDKTTGRKLQEEWQKVKIKERKALPEKEVNISDVATWQSWVMSNGVERIIRGEDVEHQGKNSSPIYAIYHNGKYVLMDGNHRVMADMLLGKKKVKLKVKE